MVQKGIYVNGTTYLLIFGGRDAKTLRRFIPNAEAFLKKAEMFFKFAAANYFFAAAFSNFAMKYPSPPYQKNQGIKILVILVIDRLTNSLSATSYDT